MQDAAVSPNEQRFTQLTPTSEVDAALNAIKTGIEAGRRVLIGFDVDGTVAPVSTDPDAVTLFPGVAESAQRLTENSVRVAAISGRSTSFLLDRFAAAPGMTLSGFNGLERISNGAKWTHPAVAEFAPKFLALQRDIDQAISPELRAAGVVVQKADWSTGVHWRLNPTLEPMVRNMMAELFERYGIGTTDFAMGLEPTPPVSIGKGNVLNDLISKTQPDLVVVFGDDNNDVPMMIAAEAFGDQRDHAAFTFASWRRELETKDPPSLVPRTARYVIGGVAGVSDALSKLSFAVSPDGHVALRGDRASSLNQNVRSGR